MKLTETVNASGIRRGDHVRAGRHGVVKVMEVHDNGRRLVVTDYTGREHTVMAPRWKRLLR